MTKNERKRLRRLERQNREMRREVEELKARPPIVIQGQSQHVPGYPVPDISPSWVPPDGYPYWYGTSAGTAVEPMNIPWEPPATNEITVKIGEDADA
jgi:hypothetical protein